MNVDASAMLRAANGSVLNFLVTLTVDDTAPSRAVPTTSKVPPLTSIVLDFCGLSVAKYIFVKTDKPVHVDLTFNPTAPTPSPAPATQTVLVERGFLLISAVSGMNITNPNSGASPQDDATVEVMLVGT